MLNHVVRRHYLPILKARQGELRALREMQEPIGDDFVPIVELVEADFDSLQPDEIDTEVQKQVRKVLGAWPPGRPRIIVDTSGVEIETGSMEMATMYGEGVPREPVTSRLLARLRQEGVRAIPVIRLSDSDDYLTDLAPFLEHVPSQLGACLRIGSEDLDDTVVPLDAAVEQLLNRTGLEASDVDLVLDFGAVDDDNTTAMAARLGRFVLPMLDRQAWRCFALAAGAFPVNLSEVPAYTMAEVPRRDRTMWLQLAGLQLRRPLDYADYAVTHPVLQTGVAFAAPPQLRYTTTESWLVVKGRRTDRRGHKQFFDLCQRLYTERPNDVSSANHSWGDQQILAAAQQSLLEDLQVTMGPGNASTWRAIATSHHFGHVLHGLRTRGEP